MIKGVKYIIDILNTGLSFRKVQELTNSKINWNTIYKFFIKLQKNDIISLSYYETVKKYTNKNLNKCSNIFITDTSLIINKLVIDNIGYNPQIPKYKSSKISLICDSKGIPLEAIIFNDSTIRCFYFEYSIR